MSLYEDGEGGWEKMDEAILARQDEAVLGDGGYITKIGPGGAIEPVSYTHLTLPTILLV